jgi:hypothetical protein
MLPIDDLRCSPTRQFSWGRSRKLAARRHPAAYFPSWLCCSAPAPGGEYKQSQGVDVSLSVLGPVWRDEKRSAEGPLHAQVSEGRVAARVFAASRRREHRSEPAKPAHNPGVLFFASLILAKQKKGSRAAARNPSLIEARAKNPQPNDRRPPNPVGRLRPERSELSEAIAVSRQERPRSVGLRCVHSTYTADRTWGFALLRESLLVARRPNKK